MKFHHNGFTGKHSANRTATYQGNNMQTTMTLAQELFASYNVRDARAEAEALCAKREVKAIDSVYYTFDDGSCLCVQPAGMFVSCHKAK